MSRVSAAIEALRKRNPDALRLARAVSFAAVVDRGLLRAARLALPGDADAGSEADLWFSSLVKNRTTDGIVLDPEAAEELRRGMTPAEVEEAWRLTSSEHQPWLAPSLLFEEEVAYLSVSTEPGARDRLVKRIQSVVRAMLKGERPGLAQWASRALRMFPTAVREMPETKMLDAGTRIRLGQGVDTTEEEPLPSWLPLVAPSSMKRTKLHVELREREMVLSAPAGSALPSAPAIDVPETVPLVLELSWQEESRSHARQVVLRSGESVRVPVGSDSVRIRTIDGAEFDVHESGDVSPALESAVIDFSSELARHPRVIGREKELALLPVRASLVLIGGDRGVGKTALLCELIRRLVPAPVFVHFFRSGDYWMGSIAAAKRSLAAQIALRYRLDDSVLDLSPGDVLARLALSPRRPQRLYIVLDDIDDARDQDRNVPDDPLAAMFSALPEFVTVFASSEEGLVNARMKSLEAQRREVAERVRSVSIQPEPFERVDRQRAAELDALDLRAREIRRERDRLLEEHGVFRLHGDVDAAFQLFGSAAQRSQGNFAMAEALSARARTSETTAILKSVMALAVARRPLPGLLFGDLLDSRLVRRDGELVELLPGYADERTADTTALPAAHSELLGRLTKHLDREDVRRYYALHAPEHLIAAGNLAEARRLALDSTFMAEVVRHYEPALMRAHLRRVFSVPTPDGWPNGILAALDREEDAIIAAPEELEAVMRSYLPDRYPIDGKTASRSALILMDAAPTRDPSPIRRHDGPIAGIIVYPAVTWSSDGRLLIWPSDPADPPVVIENATPIRAAASLRGHIAYGDVAGFLHVITTEGNVIGSVPAHAGAVAGVVGSIGAPLLASWSSDGVIRLWSFANPDGGIQPEGELAFHEDEITACAFVGGARLLVSASRDGTIRTWSVDEKRAVQVIRQESPVTGLVVSSDGRWLAAVDEAGKLRIAAVEPAAESLVKPYLIDTDTGHGIVHEIARSSDDQHLATWGGEADGVTIWRMPTASETSPPARTVFVGNPGKERVVACTFLEPQGLLFISWTNGDARLVKVEAPEEERVLLDTGGVVIRSILDRSQTFFTGDDRGRLIEWNKPGGRKARDYSKAPEQIDAIAASGNNVLTVKAGGDVRFADSTGSENMEHIAEPRLVARDESAMVWSATEDRLLLADLDGAELTRFDDDNGRTVIACALGGTPSRRAVAYDSGVIDIVDETPTRHRISLPGVIALSYASDDAVLIAATSIGIDLLDVASGEGTAFTMIEGPHSIEVDEPRRRFATVGTDRKIRIVSLDGTTHRPLDLPGEVDPALGCRFAPNGELVAIGENNRVLLWTGFDVKTASEGTLTRCAREHRGRITGFDVDHDVVYTCSEDRTVRMWSIETAEQLAVVYGYNAFRSISAAGNELVAGDDAGEVWRFTRNFGNGMQWFLDSASEDNEFTDLLRASLLRNLVELTTDSVSGGVIEIVSGPDTIFRRDVLGQTKIVVALDDLRPSRTDGSTELTNRIDFRRWRDPYEFSARLRELLDRIDGAAAQQTPRK